MNPSLLKALKTLDAHLPEIEAANQEVIHRIQASGSRLVAVARAEDVVPGMHKKLILHCGPDLPYEHMDGPMKGAISGALVYEGLASTIEEANELAASGSIAYGSCHEHQAVGPMTGVLSASMPVHVFYNPTYENYAYCSINEGLGKVLRFGANSPEVIERLRWMEHEFAPVLQEAIQRSEGGIDIKEIIVRALHMGDEVHNRNRAATSLWFRTITDLILQTSFSLEQKRNALAFIDRNDHYFLNLSMGSCKVMLDAARGVPHASVCVAIAKNGYEFGLQLASLPQQWFTCESGYVNGVLFKGYQKEDMARDMGDSSITETIGIGAFAMASAPAIVAYVGGTVEEVNELSKKMYLICTGVHDHFRLPALNFKPTPLGIDVIKVVKTRIVPVSNAGISHKQAGVGQIGAGIVFTPMAAYEAACIGLAASFE